MTKKFSQAPIFKKPFYKNGNTVVAVNLSRVAEYCLFSLVFSFCEAEGLHQ